MGLIFLLLLLEMPWNQLNVNFWHGMIFLSWGILLNLVLGFLFRNSKWSSTTVVSMVESEIVPFICEGGLKYDETWSWLSDWKMLDVEETIGFLWVLFLGEKKPSLEEDVGMIGFSTTIDWILELFLSLIGVCMLLNIWRIYYIKLIPSSHPYMVKNPHPVALCTTGGKPHLNSHHLY